MQGLGATIKDIAERLGVSVSTVSKGLNGGRDISDQLRQSILETAVEMGYESRRSKKPERRRLLVCIENMAYENPGDFGYDIVLGFRKAAFINQWDVEIVDTNPTFQSGHKYDTFMMEKGSSGAMLLGFSLEDPWMTQLEHTVLPTVLLDNVVPANPNVSYIGTDTEEAIDSAVTYLLGKGHEKIGFLDGSTGSMISDQRMEAYLSAMKRHHLRIDPDLAIYSYFTADAAHYHVPGMIDLGATAILCGNDLIAQGVMESVKDLGMRVPEDVSVIGYDDIPIAEELSPALTTIRQDRTALGKSGFFALNSMMNGTAISKTLLRARLVVRGSTGMANPRLIRRRTPDQDSVMQRNPSLYDRFS